MTLTIPDWCKIGLQKQKPTGIYIERNINGGT